MLELTRTRILEVELSSNTNNAAHSVLSQYDPVLFHEYGLLAGEQGRHIDEIIQSSLDINFFPSQYPKNEYVIDYFLFNNQHENESKIMEPRSFEYSLDYEAFLEADYAYPKEQILEYMYPRQFYLLAEPFLDKLNLLSETSKSSKIIEEKSELVSELEVFNSYTKDLMRYLDGVIIDSKGVSKIHFEEPYIRKLSFEQVSYQYFPDEYAKVYQKNIILLPHVLEDIDEGIRQVNPILDDIVTYDIYDVNWENPDQAKDEERIPDLLDELEDIEKRFITPSYEALREVKDIIGTHEKALAVIASYSSMSQESLEKINGFQERLKNEEQMISGLADSMNEELDEIKAEVDLNSMEFEEVNNLNILHERLTTNLEGLKACEDDLDRLIHYLDNYIIRKYNALKEEANLSTDLMNFIDLFVKSKFGHSQETLKEINIDTLISNIHQHMRGYTTDVFLDYQDMNMDVESEEEEKYEKQVSTLSNLDLVKTLNIQGVEGLYPHLAVDQTLLPSHLLSIDAASDGIQDATNVLDDLSKLSLLAKNTHEKILFNEYVVGMFSSIASQVDPNAKSLSGFALSDHFLEYEVEYVLGGQFNEVKNLERVLAIIFGIRVLCNVIHLTIDQVKRETILSIANTIAGWWTGGVGGVILAVVIGLCWAMMEAMIDVFLLTSGERVPFIKTSSTWYSSLDGNWEEFFNASVRRAQNEMSTYIKDTGEFTKDAVDDIQKVLDDSLPIGNALKNLDRTKVEESMKSSLNTIAEEMNVQIDVANHSIDQTIEEQLDLYLSRTLDESTKEDITYDEELDTEVIGLIEAMQSSVDSYVLDTDTNLSELVGIRETVLDAYQTQINELKEKTAQKHKEIYSKAANMASEELKSYIDDKVKEGCEITTDLLTKKADEIKKDMKGTMTKETKKKFGIKNLIPSLNYKDYLRLLLLLDQQNETVKMARVMDLIQMNIQKKYDNYEKSFMNYYRGVHIETTLKAPVNNQLPVHERLKNKLWEYHVEESEMY